MSLTDYLYYSDSAGELYVGDALEVLKSMSDESIQCCVTSPPYWGLRDYGTATWEGGDSECDHIEPQGGQGSASAKQHTNHGSEAIQYKYSCKKCGARRIDQQLGLEKTPDEYVAKMVEIFREVRRVLRDDGTLWLNLGDTYSNHKDCKSTGQSIARGTSRERAHEITMGDSHSRDTKALKSVGLKNKDLIGVPWRVAFALQAEGWYLRMDNIWNKTNPMPESVTDRPTKSHEYIFLMSKSARYYYDLEVIRLPPAPNNKAAQGKAHWLPKAGPDRIYGTKKQNITQYKYVRGANRRSVWTVATQPFSAAHFATFPEKLIEPCILAGCPKGGIVLDPFIGSCTTAVVAKRLGRRFIGIDLKAEYLDMRKDHLAQEELAL
jgi:site-specific DNA-methyltransferase (cytosine-N4-specific)